MFSFCPLFNNKFFELFGLAYEFGLMVSSCSIADDEKPPSQFKVIETSDDDEDAFIQAASEVIAAEKSVSVDAPLPTVLPVANNASVMSSAVTETS